MTTDRSAFRTTVRGPAIRLLAPGRCPRLQEPLEIPGVLVGADPGQLDVEHLDAGRG